MTARFFSICALIITVLLVRRIFRGRMDPRLTYALWLLVALRVLIPVSLFRLPASLAESTGVAQVVEMFGEIAAPKRYKSYELPGGPYSYAARVEETNVLIRDLESRGVRVFEGGSNWLEPPEQAGDPPRQMVSLRLVVPLWRWVCLGGAVVAAALQVRSNVRFAADLKRRRRPFEGALPVYCPLEVYIVDDLPSPCLFGFIDPKIYINQAAAESGHLDHILTHELTHYRHGDQWWALLRCACLCVQWYNPLVRAAARRSREECEAACDASVIQALGEDQRTSYGRTLVDMIAADAPAALCHTATTMTGDKESIYRRIKLIARKPKMTAFTAIVAVLVVLLATGRAFGGAAYTLFPPEPAPAELTEPEIGPVPMGTAVPEPSLTPEETGNVETLSAEELRWFNEEFFNSKSGRNTEGSSYSEYDGREVWYNIRNQFASPLNFYNRPEDINLYELFYLEGTVVSDVEAVSGFGHVGELPCPGYTFTGAEMDWILQANTGLTLEQTNRVGLSGFAYNPKSDTYFWLHGDTNYPGDLVCVSGVRETVDGETYVSLTLNWGSRVILLDRGEGVYWFVANQAVTAPGDG